MGKVSTLIFRLLAACVLIKGLSLDIAWAQDISSNYCNSYVPNIVNMSLSYRSAGVPISRAENIVYDLNIDDYRLKFYLISVVDNAYKSPDATKIELDSGRLVERCIRVTRGF